MDFGGDNIGYFPEDIPFMSEEELRYYGIRIPKDKPKDTSSNECVGDCEECKPSIYINCKIRKVTT